MYETGQKRWNKTANDFEDRNIEIIQLEEKRNRFNTRTIGFHHKGKQNNQDSKE